MSLGVQSGRRWAGAGSLAVALFAASLGGADHPADESAPDPRHQAIDRLFASWTRPGSPGCAVGVVEGHRIRYSAGYGLADLESKAPITPRTRFDLASTSKQITARAVALLASRGELDLDGDVRGHVPELSRYGRPMTVRHLVDHTSGLRGFFALWGLAGQSIRDSIPEERVLRVLSRQRALNFAPGERHSYSNSNYFLLAEIVERVTGRSFREVLATELFKPLEMRDTQVYDDHGELMERRAQSYERDGDGPWRRVLMKNDLTGFSGIYSTIEDLARWNGSFYREPPVGAAALAAVLASPARLADGGAVPYRFGERPGDHRGRPTLSHGGTMGGYRSFFLRFPEERLGVIVLCNALEASPFSLARQVADVWHGDPLSPPATRGGGDAREPAEVEMALDPLVGEYYSPELRAWHSWELRDGRLHVLLSDGLAEPVYAVAADRLRSRGGGTNIELRRDEEGHVVGYTVSGSRVWHLDFTRVPEGREIGDDG